MPTVIPRDPDLLRRIMVRDFASFYDRGVHIPVECDALFSKNVLMLKGEEGDMKAGETAATGGVYCGHTTGVPPRRTEYTT